ncbi:hypothetical protein KW797_02675 [Candidatus Parcubacteria bacterium]|nr:hypothetical protein [Candidatus Parcubacteria bacterium]
MREAIRTAMLAGGGRRREVQVVSDYAKRMAMGTIPAAALAVECHEAPIPIRRARPSHDERSSDQKPSPQSAAKVHVVPSAKGMEEVYQRLVESFECSRIERPLCPGRYVLVDTKGDAVVGMVVIEAATHPKSPKSLELRLRRAVGTLKKFDGKQFTVSSNALLYGTIGSCRASDKELYTEFFGFVEGFFYGDTPLAERLGLTELERIAVAPKAVEATRPAARSEKRENLNPAGHRYTMPWEEGKVSFKVA